MADVSRRRLAQILESLAGDADDEARLGEAMALFAEVGRADDPDLEALRRRYVARLVDLGRDRDAAALEIRSDGDGARGPAPQRAGSKTTLSTPSARASKSR
jgi:hypothetical protein